MKDPYQTGIEFARIFGRFEFALKRAGLLKKNRKEAQADWETYADFLGSDFFTYVVEMKLASVLIGDPPRKLMADGLDWLPEKPDVLPDVTSLLVHGVCRVRNSYMHGEKFVGGPDHAGFARDTVLLTEALDVLKAAVGRVPRVDKFLSLNHPGLPEAPTPESDVR